jgi:predicted  nucleic acid-binding Zn-ribbon protein
MIKKRSSARESELEKLAVKMTKWVGTPQSLVIHTFLFAGAFLVYFTGLSDLDTILLVVTTIVSLEAIYLALFIQLSVNRTNKSLEDVEENIEEIQEDVGALEGGVGEIVEDVEDLEGNIKKMRRNVEELEADVENISEDIDRYYLEEDKEVSQERAAHIESSKSLQNIEKEIINLSRGIIALRDDLENLKKTLP